MAKQVILGALEEVIGEYVVNIDREHLKIAALRGKVKLENVQLDGDLLGGHILGYLEAMCWRACSYTHPDHSRPRWIACQRQNWG